MTELPFTRERPEATVATPLSLQQLHGFDAVLDARSPAEFAQDHLPGAINVDSASFYDPATKSLDVRR